MLDIKDFENYIKEFKEASDEFDRVTDWRMIKKHLALNKMSRINKEYEEKLLNG